MEIPELDGCGSFAGEIVELDVDAGLSSLRQVWWHQRVHESSRDNLEILVPSGKLM